MVSTFEKQLDQAAPSERTGVVVVSKHDETPARQICYKVMNLIL